MACWSPGPCPSPKGPESCSWLSPVVAGAPLYMGRAVGRGPCYPAHPSKCLGMAPYRGGPGPHHLAQMVTIAVLPTTGGSQGPNSWLDLTASRVLPTNEGFLGLSTHVNQAATGALPLTKWVREPPPHFNPGAARAPPNSHRGQGDKQLSSKVTGAQPPPGGPRPTHPPSSNQGLDPLALAFWGAVMVPHSTGKAQGPAFWLSPTAVRFWGTISQLGLEATKSPQFTRGPRLLHPTLPWLPQRPCFPLGRSGSHPSILAWQLLRSYAPLGDQGPCLLAWTSDHHVPTSSQGLQPIPSLSQS